MIGVHGSRPRRIRGRRELVGGPELENVEIVVAARGRRNQDPAEVNRFRTQAHGLPRFEWHHDLCALAGRQTDSFEVDRSVDQPAAGGDKGHLAVREREGVGAGGRAIEKAKPHAVRGHLLVRADRTVDHDRVTESSRFGTVRTQFELVVVIELPVLHDEGKIVDAVVGRQIGRRARVVVEKEHSGQAAIDMFLCGAVRMRVVPEARGRLVDGPCRAPRLPGLDLLMRPAIHRGGQVHAMPVNARVLVKRVVDLERDRLAALRPHGGAEEVAVEPPRLGSCLVSRERRLARARRELECAHAVLHC